MLDGDSYAVMVRNVARLLAAGKTLMEARPIVLAHAGVQMFPNPSAHRSPTIH